MSRNHSLLCLEVRSHGLFRLPAIVMLTVVVCITMTACCFFPGSRYAGRNELTIHNGTNHFALVRIKRKDGVTQAELSIDAGKSKTCRLPNGSYYEVVRFGGTPEAFHYARGEGFELLAQDGQYIEASLTLHGVISGKYRTYPATAADFNY